MGTEVAADAASSVGLPPDALDGLRVLGFCDYLSPSSCGGAERVALEVYRRLVARGAAVTVVTAVPSRDRGETDVDGVRVVSVPSVDLAKVVGAQVAVSPRLFRHVAEIADAVRPQVLHANGLHFQTSLAAAVLQRSRGVPLVTTAHIAGPELLPAALQVLTGGYERTVGRFILARSARAIAVAPCVADHLARLGVPGGRIDLVPNGVDHERFFPLERRGVAGEPLVAFVGRLIGNKGPGLVLDALTALRSAGVAVRGEFSGAGPLQGRLERDAQRRGLASTVSFAGQVADVADRLRRADVVVRPSYTEGMPLAVLEAMASGVCVVASDIPGNAGLVRHGENGLLFPAGDAARLAATLGWVLANPSERQRLAAAGHRGSLAHSWEATALGTGRVLAAVAGVASPRR